MIRDASQMQYRRLGKTGLMVSLLGLGSGGPNQLGQLRPVPHRQIVALVHRALELGINLFDTASAYWESEAILAQALAGITRDRFLLASKFNPISQGSVVSPAAARALVEGSLARCRVSELDLLQLHRVEPQHYSRVRDGLLPELERLQQEGKIRFLGITESSRRDPGHQMVQMALEDDLFDTVMVAYSPFNPRAEESVFTLAQERDVGVVATAVARHLLPGGPASKVRQFVRSVRNSLGSLSQPRTFMRQFRGALSFLGRSPVRLPPHLESAMPGLAYNFAATSAAVSCVLTGTTNLAHLAENAQAVLRSPLPAEERKRLVHLLAQHAP